MLVPFEVVPQRLCAYNDEAEQEYLTSTHPTTMLLPICIVPFYGKTAASTYTMKETNHYKEYSGEP